MSRPSITAYHRVGSLEEAWSHIASADPAVRLLSGGADLTIHAPPEVTTLVDLADALDEAIVAREDGSIAMGAMATLTAVHEHPAVARYASGVIPEMMVHVGNPLLRNFSTIGGHLARGKLSDVVPVFLALDATVTIYRDGTSGDVALSEYFEKGHSGTPHIVTWVSLPAPAGRTAAAFQRFARTAFDFAILNACCRVDVDDGAVTEARVVLGATPYRSARSAGAESHLLRHGLDSDSIAAAADIARAEVPTGGGWVASAEYRSHLVEVLVRRCLTAVSERLGDA